MLKEAHAIMGLTLGLGCAPNLEVDAENIPYLTCAHELPVRMPAPVLFTTSSCASGPCMCRYPIRILTVDDDDLCNFSKARTDPMSSACKIRNQAASPRQCEFDTRGYTSGSINSIERCGRTQKTYPVSKKTPTLLQARSDGEACFRSFLSLLASLIGR